MTINILGKVSDTVSSILRLMCLAEGNCSVLNGNEYEGKGFELVSVCTFEVSLSVGVGV